jgi:mono/diheme cytochrome c family protein
MVPWKVPQDQAAVALEVCSRVISLTGFMYPPVYLAILNFRRAMDMLVDTQSILIERESAGVTWMRAIMAVLMIGALACSGDGESGPTDPPTSDAGLFAAVQSIFTGNCAFSGCHAGDAPQQGMNLSAGLAYSNIVGVASHEVPRLLRVAPSDPDSSYLVLKVEGNAGLVGGVGTQMPLGGVLSQVQIDTIRAWIAAGAEN